MLETVLLYVGGISGLSFLFMITLSLLSKGFNLIENETTTNFLIFSFKNILAFTTVFPLTTYFLLSKGVFILMSFAVGVIVGILSVTIFTSLFMVISRLISYNTTPLVDIIGQTGSVSRTIPPRGTGQISILINGVFQHIPATSRTGKQINYGKSVQILDVLDTTTVIVEII